MPSRAKEFREANKARNDARLGKTFWEISRRGILVPFQELVAEDTEPDQVVSFATLPACGLSKKTPVPGKGIPISRVFRKK